MPFFRVIKLVYCTRTDNMEEKPSVTAFYFLFTAGTKV